MSRALNEIRPSLPAHWYYDDEHYQRELAAVWYRDWVCVGHRSELRRDGDYLVAKIGAQSVIITQAPDGKIRAWHNTCRHRGSLLCKESRGRFRNGRIVCPYHTWTYSTDGKLLATPGRLDADDFNHDDYSLFGVHVAGWKGFIFVNLSDTPKESLDTFLGDEKLYLANWPIESMHSVHREVITVNCNWKLFWENYSECYHCPRLHPELCKVMPVYREAVFDDADLPGWKPRFEGDRGFGRVADGASTWTMDGKTASPDLKGLSEEEREIGVVFSSVNGSMYVVGHPDYVRSVRIVPQGPEQIELVVDWMLPEDFGEVSDDLIEHITGLAKLVIRQDGEACELNQQGLKSPRFEQGVLVPQEYPLWDFHEWLRQRLNDL